MVVLSLVLLLAYGSFGASAPETIDLSLIVAQLPHRSTRSVRQKAEPVRLLPADGGRLVSLASDGKLAVLTAGFASAANPSVSYDGRRILFSGKRNPKDSWNVWEMDLDGSNPRQLTADFGNCFEPRYLATSSITPPEFVDKVRWIAFVSDGADVLDEQEDRLATALYAQNIEPVENRGIVRRRSTFNLSSDFSPTVLSDGRLLFTSHQPPGRGDSNAGRFPLMVTNWDGTVLNNFVGGNDGVKSMAVEMPNRTLVFVESPSPDAQGGRLARVSFKRPFRSRETLSTDDGIYRSPHALPDGRLLVSFSRGAGPRGIYLFDFEKGTVGRAVHSDPRWDDLEVAAAAARPEPQGLLSAVVDGEANGDLQCMNVYDSDLPDIAGLKKGVVRKARFIEGIPQSPKERQSAGPKPAHALNSRIRILGESPVEADGSFYVRIPGDTPFYVQILDGDGMALQTQRSWIWIRRGTSGGCIGCHENKELAPENKATQALMGIQPHSLLTPPDQRPSAVDFLKAVRPVLSARCASCHAGPGGAGGIDFRMSSGAAAVRTYERLLGAAGSGREHVVPGSARTSPLLEVLMPGDSSGNPKTKHPPITISPAEKRLLIEWIDLGARWQN